MFLFSLSPFIGFRVRGSQVLELFALRESRRGNWQQAVGGLEAQKLGGSDMLILEASWIFLMASGVIEHNSERITLGGSWGLLGAILKPLWGVLGSLGAVWGALGVVLGALGVVLGWSWELLGRS